MVENSLLLSLSMLKVEIKCNILDGSKKNRVVNLRHYHSAIGLFQLKAPKRVQQQQPNHMNRILNLTPKEAFQILFLAEFVPKGAGGLTNFHKKRIFQPYLNLILYKNTIITPCG